MSPCDIIEATVALIVRHICGSGEIYSMRQNGKYFICVTSTLGVPLFHHRSGVTMYRPANRAINEGVDPPAKTNAFCEGCEATYNDRIAANGSAIIHLLLFQAGACRDKAADGKFLAISGVSLAYDFGVGCDVSNNRIVDAPEAIQNPSVFYSCLATE